MHPYLRFHLLLRRVDPGPRDPHPRHERSLLAAAQIRRVLGKTFIDRFCPFGEPRCQARQRGGKPRPARELCQLAASCPYGVLFAASHSPRPPFAIYVPEPDPEDDFGLVELSLFGPGWTFYPWALATLQQALRGGVGKARSRWEIQEVRRLGDDRSSEPVCGGDLSGLSPALRPDLLQLAVAGRDAAAPVEVELLSPTRLLRRGKLLPGRAAVPLDLLVGRVLDRFGGLFGAGASDLLRPEVRAELEARAARVKLLADHTRWVEISDYSARSGLEIRLGGKVGRLVYGRGAARFLDVLRVGEVLHIGKSVASGCGRLRADPAEVF